MQLKYIILLSLTLTFSLAKAQYFATLKVNTHDVYKQQPIKATVTVYTTTWFTDSPDLGTVNVPNSFVLPFKRTLSGIQYVNRKQYSTLEFFYLIFPFESGELTIPELHINISTPPEGDYKGVPRQLKTKPVKVNVKDVPDNYKGDEWLVSKDAYISDRWSQPLNDVKVGEVIERTITIRALGTLPAFIPQTAIADNNWSSIYPKEAQLKDTRTNQDANGVRIEKYRYLLEKEGEFDINPVAVTWFNPYLNKQYSRSTKAQKIIVKPNTDLGMLATMRDSLNTNTASSEVIVNDDPFLILGLSLKDFLLLLAVITVCMMVIIKATIIVTKQAKARKAAYIHSEEYLYHQFLKTSNKSGKQQLNALYLWQLKRKNKNITIGKLKNEAAHHLVASVAQQKEEKLNRKQMKSIKKDLSAEKHAESNFFPPINP